MAKLANKQEFTEMVESGELVIVDFFATWCGPCQMFLPVFDQVSTDMADTKMIKIDIDLETELAGANSVQGVPTIIAFKDGKEVARFSGFVPAEKLVEFINENK